MGGVGAADPVDGNFSTNNCVSLLVIQMPMLEAFAYLAPLANADPG